MKKLLFLITLLTIFIGGVNSVKAERTYGSISVVYQATWNSGTSTMGWTEAGGWYILSTGLPTGDITAYTTFHATLSNFSENADFIRLIIKDGTNEDVVRLVEGENIVNLTTLPNCDYTKITEVNLWGSDAAKEGKTIDGNNPASVVVTDVYMERPDAPFVSTVSNGFGDEFTSLEGVTNGTKFVIGNTDYAMYWIGGNVDNQKTGVKNVPVDAYYYFVLEKVDGLDTDGDDIAEDDNYRIRIENAAGTAFPHPWGGHGPYLNYSMWGHLWASSCDADKGSAYGGDGQYYAIWKVAYSEGKGFTIKNAAVNKYVKVIGTDNAVTYLKFYKSIDFTSRTMYPANDEIFALSKATGYDEETGEMTNGTWTFNTPVDLSNWKYLIIAMENGCADGTHAIEIKDNSGHSIKEDAYNGEDAGTGQNLWFSRWHHQNIGAISLDYLLNNGIDIRNFKSLSIAGTTKPFAVYLSCYDNTRLVNIGRWTCYKDGDLVRNYVKADIDNEDKGKYGTICLPYKASVAGAEVYSIASGNTSYITLTKVNGLLEAGKPYFYKACDMVGKNNHGGEPEGNGDIHAVNFFRADFDRYDIATAGKNNGLVGTYAETTAPQGENIWILNNNKLYDTANSHVNVDPYKAWINIDEITNNTSAKARAIINFGDGTTNINQVDEDDAVKALNSGKIYDLSGREVARPTRGFYIIGKSKVWIK